MKQVPDYFHRKTSNYVPAMGYASDVVHNGLSHFSLGTPAPASGLTSGILAATSLDTALDTTTFVDDEADATYGRNVIIDLSGAGTPAVTIYGRDYLGQPMAETLTGAGTTAVEGLKAFKWIDRATGDVVGGGVTVNIGWGDVLGLPYKTHKVVGETSRATATGVVTAQSLGTFVIASEVDPATATTGDPRGTYNPTATLATTTEIFVDCICSAYVNAAGNGGLHGIAHYYA